MAADREDMIEQVVLMALYEATTDSFFGVKATKVLELRSDIDKKRRQIGNSDPEAVRKLKEISESLVEAERKLGELLEHDNKRNGYIPMTKDTI